MRFSWRKGSFKIAREEGSKRVHGFILGRRLAVHFEPLSATWTLSHIKSGYAVQAHIPSEEKARALARVLIRRPKLWDRLQALGMCRMSRISFKDFSWVCNAMREIVRGGRPWKASELKAKYRETVAAAPKKAVSRG
jgi:hypothetical protein